MAINNNTKVTIALLNFNGFNYLQKVLPKLAELTYKNLEILIVDNCSNDESISYIKTFPTFKLIQNDKNLGYSAGKNICVEKASGEYVLLLDGDIVINKKNIIEEILKHLENNEKTIFTFILKDIDQSDETAYYGAFLKPYCIADNKFRKIESILKHELDYSCSYPHGGALFVNKDFFLNVFKKYDEIQTFNLDDFDLGMFAWNSGYEVKLLNGFYLDHLGIGKSSNRKLMMDRLSLWISGISIAMTKNVSFSTFIIHYPQFLAFFLTKGFKQLLINFRGDYLLAVCKGLFKYLSLLKYSLQKRKYNQSMRKVKKDLYFDQKVPF